MNREDCIKGEMVMLPYLTSPLHQQVDICDLAQTDRERRLKRTS